MSLYQQRWLSCPEARLDWLMAKILMTCQWIHCKRYVTILKCNGKGSSQRHKIFLLKKLLFEKYFYSCLLENLLNFSFFFSFFFLFSIAFSFATSLLTIYECSLALICINLSRVFLSVWKPCHLLHLAEQHPQIDYMWCAEKILFISSQSPSLQFN